jgi:hypothetical protein
LSTAWARRFKLALGTIIVVVLGSNALTLFDVFNGRKGQYRDSPLVLHADFVAYYTAAKMVVGGAGHHLYNLFMQAPIEAQVTGMGYTLVPFVNPPFLALVLAPLGHLPYLAAFLIWDAVMLVAMVGAVCILVRAAGFKGISFWLVTGVALSTTSILVVLLMGQSTAFVLLGLALCYACWQKNKMGWAGVALTLTLFKPNLVLLMPLLLVARREWRALAWFGIVSVALVVVSAIAFGPQVWVDYLRLIGPQAAGTAMDWTTGARTQFGLLGIVLAIGLNQQVGLVICAGFGLWLVSKIARRKGQLPMDYALCVVASFVIAPHANFHDASILVAAGILVAGVVAHDKRASLFDKLVLAGVILVGMTIVAIPAIVTAFVFLLWVVHLDYTRFLLSPDGAKTAAKI